MKITVTTALDALSARMKDMTRPMRAVATLRQVVASQDGGNLANAVCSVLSATTPTTKAKQNGASSPPASTACSP